MKRSNPKILPLPSPPLTKATVYTEVISINFSAILTPLNRHCEEERRSNRKVLGLLCFARNDRFSAIFSESKSRFRLGFEDLCVHSRLSNERERG